MLNNQETGRIGADSIIDERTWREVYLPPFESAVAHGALSAMCSYNRITLNNVTAWACGHLCGNQPFVPRRVDGFHAIELLQLRSCVCAMAWRFHAIDATSAP